MKAAGVITFYLLFFNLNAYSQVITEKSEDTISLYNFASDKRPLKDPLKFSSILIDSTYERNFEFRLGNLNLKLNNKFIYSIYNIPQFSITQLVENLYNPLKFKYNAENLEEGFMHISIYQYDYTDESKINYSRIPKSSFLVRIRKDMKLDIPIADRLVECLDSLNLISFSFSKEEETESIARVLMGMYGENHILNIENEPVQVNGEHSKWIREIPLSLIRSKKDKEYASIDKDYAFQFIDHNGRQIMKTDTMSASVKSYLNYYRKKPEYEILHMNGFKTKDRFIKFKSDWGQCDTCGAITELAKIDDTEFLHLYEYCPLSDTLIKIQIGDISQDSHIQFYDRSWFLKNVSKGLSIHLPEGDFKPAYLEFILYDPIKDNNFIRTDNINNDKLKTLWNQLPDIAGMYIQNIVFVDTQGNRTRIPNTFHFNISK